MRRDKAGLTFRGAPLWRRQLDTLRQAGAGEILISGRRGACYDTGDIPIIEDEIEDAGPLGGVSALLSAAAHPLVLVLAIDMPLMTAVYLRHLLAQTSGECGVVPEQFGRYEGLAAIYPKTAKEIATEALGGRDHSMQHFVTACMARKLVAPVQITEAEISFFQNINTPEEHAKISR